jgi:hypothetical protein
MRAHFFSVLAISGLSAAYATNAHAWNVGQTCGSSPANWNAPNGAIVANSSSSPIKSIMNSLGESRTHTIISHGNGWASHATTAQPSQSAQTCGQIPINPVELAQGYTGFSAVNVGAMSAVLSGSTFIKYQIPYTTSSADLSGAEGTANFVWDWSPRPGNNFTWQWHSNGYYILGQTEGTWFRRYHYEFNQYMNSAGRLDGDIGNGAGSVCTTAIGYSYANWRFYDNPSFHRGNIPKHSYSKQQTVNAGNALFSAIWTMCYQGLGWFGQTFDWVASCNAATTCERAAWQTLNCFFSGRNVSGSCNGVYGSSWNAYVADNSPQGNQGAASLSPDGLLGWSGLPTNDNLWAPYVDNNVQWNGEGNVYGCWF